jgi:hypothetical protein
MEAAMRPELAARLHQIIKGESLSENVVTAVTPVTELESYGSNALELRRLRLLRVENINLGNCALALVIPPVTECPNSEYDAALHERAGMAADSVPVVYLDAWARLNCRRPANVTGASWRQALDDGGRFLDAWGNMAAEEQWSVGEIFDVPRAGLSGGLIWKIAGRAVESFGPKHARFDDGEVFERNEGADCDR